MNFNNSEVEVDSFGRTIIREQRIDDGMCILMLYILYNHINLSLYF